MKLNISYPAHGTQKAFECNDDKKLAIFNEKRISQEVYGEAINPEWKGYIFRISGGNDKQGFPLLQGVLTNQRVKLLMKKGSKCYRERRSGQRKKKSVRGCILDVNQLSCVNLVIIKEGDKPIEPLDEHKPKRLGPKRASKIRKMFNLDKSEDVRRYVVKRKVEKNGKVRYKSPKIQRLVTPLTLQRKRARRAFKLKRRIASAAKKAAYEELLHKRRLEARSLKQE
ncbi:small ribosomal subunit protein eS6-like [Zophobas morio]|uniref:small ribosomal subunit protein eS6-like n=1 Tax=Zophobas morio TaxID=2755281 RepID=UPI0030832C2B